MTGWYRRVDLIRPELSRTRGIENHGDVEAVERGCCRGRAGSGGGTWAGGEDVRCGDGEAVAAAGHGKAAGADACGADAELRRASGRPARRVHLHDHAATAGLRVRREAVSDRRAGLAADGAL